MLSIRLIVKYLVFALVVAVVAFVTIGERAERAAGNDPDPCFSTASGASHCEAFHNTCATYTMEPGQHTFDLYVDKLEGADINGVSFPRTERTQYRGLSESVDQFTVGKVLRAIGGDPTPTIGSRLHWLLQSALMKPERLASDKSFIANLGRAYRWRVLGKRELLDNLGPVFDNHGILNEVHALLTCRPKYDERDAAIYARDLSLKAMRYLEKKWGDRFTKYMFAYKTKEFAAYGDFAGGLDLYSTAYPTMANAYGSKVLVFHNKAHKALDLNYWNFRENHGIWADNDADRAEFVTAVDIDPDAVLGIWKTDETHRDGSGRDRAMTPRTLAYALMRLDIDGVGYGVVLDAHTTACVIQVDSHFEGCQDRMTRSWGTKDTYDVARIDFGKLVPDGRTLPVIAAVRACAIDDAACGVPDSLFAGMPVAQRRLTDAEMREISQAHFRIDGRLFEQRIRQAQ